MSDVIKSRIVYQPHEDRIYHETTQPNEDLILAQNAELRKDNALGDLSFGRQVASIPFIVYYKAIREGYKLNDRDSKVASSEMFRFLKSEEGKLCMVRSNL
jgi:hypothetical protein